MDKSKLKPYESKEELMSNAENIQQEWKKEEYKGCVFSARHVADDPEHPENCLHLYWDNNKGHICSTNRVAFVRHMLTHEGLTPVELEDYEERLALEFTVWMRMEADRLVKLEEKQIKETEKEAELTAFFVAQALSRQNKYKS